MSPKETKATLLDVLDSHTLDESEVFRDHLDAELFALILYCERRGYIDIDDVPAGDGWSYRFSDAGAKIARAVFLDPYKRHDLYLFTLLVARAEDELPRICNDGQLDEMWRAATGHDLEEALEHGKKVLR